MLINKIFYLCDGNKQECKKSNCYKKAGTSVDVCRHTTDINHAMNFEEEIPRNQNKFFGEKETGKESVDAKFNEIMFKDIKLKIAEALLDLEMQMRIRKPENRISPMEKRIIEEKANQLKEEINTFIDSEFERIRNSFKKSSNSDNQ